MSETSDIAPAPTTPETPAGTPRSRALPGAIAGGLAFFGSAAVLVLEILGARILAPYVGITQETYTAIIGTVLTGISLGTWLGGKLADRLDPRSLLGPLLIIGGATVLLTVPVIRFLADGVRHPDADVVIVLAFAGMFLPAAVLSAINPTLIKLQLSDLHSTGAVVGRLSALATAGAIVGTFTTGFLLIAALPTSRILAVMGVVLIVTGIVIQLLLGRFRGLPRQVTTIALVASLLGLAATLSDQGVCDKESSYYCIQVFDDPDRPTGRFIQLDDTLHGYSDVRDPTHLEFNYVRYIAAAADVVRPTGAAIEALSVGGGAFTLPRYIEATRPGSRNTVLEVDPRVVEVAEERLGLVKSASMHVRVGDARTNIRFEPDRHYDFVVGDAFGGEAVPWHLTTQEFLQELRRVMKDDATYAMNVIDFKSRGFVRAEIRTLQEVFDDVVLVIDDRNPLGGNHIVVASPTRVNTEALAAGLGLTKTDVRILHGQALDEFVSDATILRDDYAPVDQLITPASEIL